MQKIKIILVALFVMASASSYGQKKDKEYTEAVKKMFISTGAEESYKTVVHQMLSMLKESHSDIDKKIWDGLEEEFINTSIGELAEMYAPIYKKYLTIEDIKEITRFYKTGTGKKFKEFNPVIMKEVMDVGKKWVDEIGEKFVKKLKEKGY